MIGLKPGRLSLGLKDDGSPIGEHFRYTVGNIVGVIAHADDRVGAYLAGMLQHKLEGFLARMLAHLGRDGDISAEDLLDACAERTDNAARAHGDASNDSEVLLDFVTIESKCGGDEHILIHKKSFPQLYTSSAWKSWRQE